MKYLEHIIDMEGGFVDHPLDMGGATKYGITYKTLSRWRGFEVYAKDVSELTKEEAIQIYARFFVVYPKLDMIECMKKQYLVVDAAVLHGQANAIRMAQDTVGSTPDGIMGRITAGLINEMPFEQFLSGIMLRRACFIGELIGRMPSQQVFRNGWINRLEKVTELSKKMNSREDCND